MTDTAHAFGTRKLALINATIRLVGRQGMRNLTYRAVASEAGVAHGLVAHHFGSIDALIDASLRQSIDESITTLSFTPASGRVEDFATGFIDAVDELSDVLSFQINVALESRRSPELVQQTSEIREAYRSAIRAALTDMNLKPDDGMVEFVYASLEGVALHHIFGVSRARNELALERVRVALALDDALSVVNWRRA